VDCVAVVDQVIALLRQRGRLTYRTLQLQFQLDEAHLEALKEEIISGQRLAVDEAGVEDVPQLCQVLWGLYYFHVVRAELHTVREVSGELLTLAQHLQDPMYLQGAHFALGSILLYLGELSGSRAQWAQSLALYATAQHHAHVGLFGIRCATACRSTR
jgi:hypothetical protein